MGTVREPKQRNMSSNVQLSQTKKYKIPRKWNPPLNFPPTFWDKLAKVLLTCRALREIDRRHCQKSATRTTISTDVVARDLCRFARSGGPDLSHLRDVSFSDAHLVVAYPYG